jgi:uncharacterized membrane protein
MARIKNKKLKLFILRIKNPKIVCALGSIVALILLNSHKISTITSNSINQAIETIFTLLIGFGIMSNPDSKRKKKRKRKKSVEGNNIPPLSISGDELMDKKVTEHVEKRTITEYLHTPEHDERTETREFRNAKRELEDISHLPCFVCKCQGVENHFELQSHHIIERSWANSSDMKKIAKILYNFRDYHGIIHRDFKSEDEFYQFLKTHDDPSKILDLLYNQLILCKAHHIGEGTGIHYETAPTFDASLVMVDGFHNSLTQEEYEQMKQQLLVEHGINKE